MTSAEIADAVQKRQYDKAARLLADSDVGTRRNAFLGVYEAGDLEGLKWVAVTRGLTTADIMGGAETCPFCSKLVQNLAALGPVFIWLHTHFGGLEEYHANSSRGTELLMRVAQLSPVIDPAVLDVVADLYRPPGRCC